MASRVTYKVDETPITIICGNSSCFVCKNSKIKCLVRLFPKACKQEHQCPFCSSFYRIKKGRKHKNYIANEVNFNKLPASNFTDQRHFAICFKNHGKQQQQQQPQIISNNNNNININNNNNTTTTINNNNNDNNNNNRILPIRTSIIPIDLNSLSSSFTKKTISTTTTTTTNNNNEYFNSNHHYYDNNISNSNDCFMEIDNNYSCVVKNEENNENCCHFNHQQRPLFFSNHNDCILPSIFPELEDDLRYMSTPATTTTTTTTTINGKFVHNNPVVTAVMNQWTYNNNIEEQQENINSVIMDIDNNEEQLSFNVLLNDDLLSLPDMDNNVIVDDIEEELLNDDFLDCI